jgi:hypothetical protein
MDGKPKTSGAASVSGSTVDPAQPSAMHPITPPDLSMAEDEELFAELVKRGLIGDDDAEDLMNRACLREIVDIVADAYEEACARIRRGERAEALIWLERALGDPWTGRLAGA